MYFTICVVEANNNQVSVRQRGEGDRGSMSITDFEQIIRQAIENELSTNV